MKSCCVFVGYLCLYECLTMFIRPTTTTTTHNHTEQKQALPPTATVEEKVQAVGEDKELGVRWVDVCLNVCGCYCPCSYA